MRGERSASCPFKPDFGLSGTDVRSIPSLPTHLGILRSRALALRGTLRPHVLSMQSIRPTQNPGGWPIVRRALAIAASKLSTASRSPCDICPCLPQARHPIIATAQGRGSDL